MNFNTSLKIFFSTTLLTISVLSVILLGKGLVRLVPKAFFDIPERPVILSTDGYELEFGSSLVTFDSYDQSKEFVEYIKNQSSERIGLIQYALNPGPEINPIDIEALKKGIVDILGNDPHNYGVYLYDTKRNIELGINEARVFPPMSISKLPVGLMTMIAVNNGELALDQVVPFRADAVASPTNVLSADYVGVEFKIRDYLQFLLVDSDNSSIRMLEIILGGHEALNEKVKDTLGVEHFFRQPHDATAYDVGKVWRGIYGEQYLNTENNTFLVQMLQNTSYLLQDGFPVGVPYPYNTQIAHKTGQGASDPGYIWEDSGIIFGPETDYILVVLNDNIHVPDARYKIQQISGLVWDTLQVPLYKIETDSEIQL